ncbi:protein of unknown function [Magnetospirillum sp. XM-1]|uniref:hypothetical protein n=1 Tax=Magnetospirillum sp. XM-1 TaxID=1663591 RepID=UPI00073DDC31|nr:hypothetical protein [Magnetospirillum sp. XM-1]CUW40306.1 protein of unknown function [Magnetospirillum sp. XM-1]
MNDTPRKKGLPRHVIGAVWTLFGFVGGITLLLVLPKYFGVPPKLAGFISMVFWLGSTWVFWTGGEEPPKRTEQPGELPKAEN